MNYGAGETETLDTLIDLAATIWDEYGAQITAWVWEKGVKWTLDKVKSILKKKQDQAASTKGVDALTGGAFSLLMKVLEDSRNRNLSKARQGILDALKLRDQMAQSTVKDANKTGEKFTVSNVFSKQEAGGSDWMASAGALVLGAAVGGAGLWAYKKYWKRS